MDEQIGIEIVERRFRRVAEKQDASCACSPYIIWARGRRRLFQSADRHGVDPKRVAVSIGRN